MLSSTWRVHERLVEKVRQVSVPYDTPFCEAIGMYDVFFQLQLLPLTHWRADAVAGWSSSGYRMYSCCELGEVGATAGQSSSSSCASASASLPPFLHHSRTNFLTCELALYDKTMMKSLGSVEHLVRCDVCEMRAGGGGLSSTLRGDCNLDEGKQRQVFPPLRLPLLPAFALLLPAPCSLLTLSPCILLPHRPLSPSRPNTHTAALRPRSAAQRLCDNQR